MECSSTDYHAALGNICNRYPLTPFVRQRSTPDRYGFSYLISRELKYNRIPRSFANWLHGWVWWPPQSIEDFGFQSDPPYYTKIVSNESQLNFLRDLGINNIVAAGLPYAYLFRPGSDADFVAARIGNSAVFVPDHSSESNKVDFNIYQYLDFIDSVKHKFNHISILLYSLDYDHLSPIVTQRGYSPLLGADPQCPNSFSRVKAIFDTHEYVSTNIIGSHVLYALASGCRVSICGPQQKRTLEPHLEDICLGLYSLDYITRYLHHISLEFLRTSWLSFLLVDDPADATLPSPINSVRIDDALGISSLMNASDVSNLLGWSSDRQFTGYLLGAGRRFKRLVGLQRRY